MKRRRLARLLTLVLLAELALVCCASAHILRHACGDDCAVCQCVRQGQFAALPALRTALAAIAGLALAARLNRHFDIAPATLVGQKVRLND